MRHHQERVTTPDGRDATITTTVVAEIERNGSYRYDVAQRVVAEPPKREGATVPALPPRPATFVELPPASRPRLRPRPPDW